MLMGWASGSFGLFGLKKDDVQNPVLNYAGVVVALLALCVYLRVKPEDMNEQASDGSSRKYRTLSADRNSVLINMPFLEDRGSSGTQNESQGWWVEEICYI